MFDAYQCRQQFLKLVDDLRAALGYALRDDQPEPGEELAMEMMYGNFDFAVVHSMKNQPGRVLIECQFGEIPDGRFDAIVERLLQMNAALAEIDGSVFCLDADNKSLIYTLSQALEELDGTRLLSKMTEIVWHGRRWLETRFLPQESQVQAERLDPLQLA